MSRDKNENVEPADIEEKKACCCNVIIFPESKTSRVLRIYQFCVQSVGALCVNL